MIPLYLDPGSGGFLFQLLAAGGLTVIGLLISRFKQRVNYIVLVGALLTIGCIIYLQVKDNTTLLRNPYIMSDLILGLPILILLFLNWRWRAIPWIILSVVGIYGTLSAINLFKIREAANTTLSSNYLFNGTSYKISLFIIIIGYTIIICGSVWELIRKNKQSVVTAMPKAGKIDDDEDDEE